MAPTEIQPAPIVEGGVTVVPATEPLPTSVTLSNPIPEQPEITPQSKPKEIYVAFRAMYGKETADEVFPGVAKKLHEEGLRQQAIIDKRKAAKKRERQAKKRNRR